MMTEFELPFAVKRPILVCGADLKGAFAFAKGKRAVFVGGFGDLSELDNFSRYEKAVKKWQDKLRIRPGIIACDLHPGYFSTGFAEHLQLKAYSLQLCKIQHHEAHVASAIIDNSLKNDVIGVAFDGTGFGYDGNIWGGEFFVGSPKKFKRAAHFEYIPMPGGERAIREPWRMALAYLFPIRVWKYGLNAGLLKKLNKKDMAIVKLMIDKNINSPLTSSAGRLFDAVGSLVLSKTFAGKEAELPMELEKMAEPSCKERYDFDIKRIKKGDAISASKIIKGVIKDLSKGADKRIISAKFHNTMAEVITKVSLKLSKRFGPKRVVLSGGVFQNKFLTARAVTALRRQGLAVYVHSRFETSDAGIPIGQIAIANTRCRF